MKLMKRKKHLHILEAEWGHVSNPTYLQKLVEKHLPGWQPLQPTQLRPLKGIPFRERPLSIPESLFRVLPGGIN